MRAAAWRLGVVVAAVLVLADRGLAGRDEPAPPTIAVATAVVRIDVAVTGRGQEPVTGLGPADFEVREEGRPQAITQFLALGPAARASSLGGRRTGAPPAESATSAAAAAAVAPWGRRVVFVIDDLSLSAESLQQARPALAEALGRLEPGDSAALVAASALPRQLVMISDPGELQRLARALRWNGLSGRTKAIDPIEIGLLEQMLGAAGLPVKPGAELERERDTLHLRGTLEALDALVQALAAVPGRKAVVLLSDSLKLRPIGRDLFERLGADANRASVSAYSLDTRGVQPLNMAADDYVTVPGAAAVTREELAFRSYEFGASQSGMRELAEQTGGLFLGGSALRRSLARVLADTGVYYVLGYTPGTDDGRGPRLRRIEVKVKRRGCSVRARSRYFG